eukprot:INCI13973.2.p1 GENE.INCI13973.2~~INCI13973.2.p1  ORF type:complete len:542 (+),score=83.83 INCI13973.2:990-2615(+)
MFDQNTTVMEEGHLVPRVARGGCYTMARTDKGFIAASWTADSTGSSGWLGEGAETKLARYWDPRTPVDAAATPLLDINFSSSLLAHPLSGVTSYATALKSLRGPFTPKHQPNGQYLLIFYNNNAARDPYFLSAGIESEADGQILWGQPELGLYDRVHVGTAAGGYPDFISGVQSGGTYITVAQKGTVSGSSTAYIHRVDDELLEQLFGQRNSTGPPNQERLVVAFNSSTQGQSIPLASGTSWPTLELPLSEKRQGLSVLARLSAAALSSATDEEPLIIMRSGNISLQYLPSEGLVLGLVAKNLNYTSASFSALSARAVRDDDGSSTAEYSLVREGSEPAHDDALPGVPCQNGVFSGTGDDRAAQGCAERCGQTPGCAAFWSYTSNKSTSFGRCCLKGANWENSTNPQDWVPIAGGGFYAMTGPPTPQTPTIRQDTATDASCAALLAHSASDDRNHTIAVIVDAGVQLIMFVVDGMLCDGGGVSPAGFFWVNAEMGQLIGDDTVEVAPGVPAGSQYVLDGGLYFRALYTSEVVAFHRGFLLH